MTERVSLKGLTWDHPRAYEGLEAETDRFNASQDGIYLTWDRHSLRGFEATPIVDTAARYDLIILDHPFMGDASTSRCLMDLSTIPRLADAVRAENFVGPSLESYRYAGGLWALPIDAACQVAAWRPDRLEQPPSTLDELRALTQHARIALAMACPHAFMNFLCIAGMSGADISGGEDQLLPREIAIQSLELLREVAASIPQQSVDWSSIDVHDALAASDDLAYCPMVFCFNTYARDARAGSRLRFAAPPLAGAAGPVGAIAGGTGLAISAYCNRSEEAAEAVRFLAAADGQVRCAIAGGQPARIEAWTDREADEANGHFFSDCLSTMSRASLRPRYPGFMELQNAAGNILREDAMNPASRASVVIDRIDDIYRRTRGAGLVYGALLGNLAQREGPSTA